MPPNDNTVQSALLNELRKTRKTVCIYLTNGVRLGGVTIESFDAHVVTLRCKQETQLVQKSAISTVAPDVAHKPSPQRVVDPVRARPDAGGNRKVTTITVKRRVPRPETV